MPLHFGLKLRWATRVAEVRCSGRGGTLKKDIGGSARNADLPVLKGRRAGEGRILPYVKAGQRQSAGRDGDEAPPAKQAGAQAPVGSRARVAAAPAPAAGVPVPARADAAALFSREIPRFRRSERELHWAIAIPFMVCLASGVTVKLFYNKLHSGILMHAALLWVHRASGVLLILLPLWVAWRHRKDLSLYLYNIKRAWSWTADDLRWLALIGLASLSKKIALPEQHKFNAGEKVNFMALTLTYPVLVVTGALILMPGMHFLSFIVHVSVAVLAAPLIIGHIFMAVVNPDTRVGLSGMFSGNVDREWARHHYAKWYRENFGEDAEPQADPEDAPPTPPVRAIVRCLSCGAATPLTSWDALLETVSQLRPLDCPACGAPSPMVSAVVKAEEIETILEGLQHAGASGPRRQGLPENEISLAVPSAEESAQALPATCPERV
jgi:formate dehydrogenase gamma subunit